MTIKSTLLGFAAAFAALGSAAAADLPMSKGEAVEYVKVCSTFGPGFFYIPGSDTCLQISGQIRADYFYQEPATRLSNATTFRSQLRIRFDARTQTDYGLVRSFLELQADNNSLGTTQNGASGTNFMSVRQAYLQFGGLTAGYAWSPYAFYDKNYQAEFFAPYFGEQGRRELLSYTAQFDKFWATLSVEDSAGHRAAGSGFGKASTDATKVAPSYAGTDTPDIVAAVGYDDNKQGLGRFQVMAALHQNRSLFGTSGGGSNYGYAIGAAGNINIPVLAGAYIAAEGSYADGAVKYLGVGSASLATGFDAYGDSGTPHDLTRAKGWTVQAEAGLNITPALQAVLFGGYLKYDAPSIDAHVSDNFNYYVVGGQVNYTVVKGFIAGAEVWYQNKDPQGSTPDSHLVGAGLRLRRTF